VLSGISDQARTGGPAPVALTRHPWLAVIILAVCAGVAGVALLGSSAPIAVSVVLGFASYLVASRLPRRRSVPFVAAAAAALLAARLYAAVAVGSLQMAAQAVEFLLPMAAAWFVGDSVAARRKYQAGLAEQAERERAAEAELARQNVREERVRIARELHDVVAHALAVVTVQAGVGRRLMDRRPEEAVRALETIEAIGRTAQEELRVVLGLLREEGIADAALSPAPRLADLKELVETVRASGTPVELRLTDIGQQLSPALQLSVYRIVQEALTNVVKHAPSARATVDVAIFGQDVRVKVFDEGSADGRGAGLARAPGHGILGMRERIAAFGGSLAAGPCPDGGFLVLAEIPLNLAA
jgi:signal transduction histidine kinase